MAKSDRSSFLGVLARAEVELRMMLAQVAHDVGDLVLRAAGPDGLIPVEGLAQLQRQAEQVVDAALIGQARQPFDEAGNPASPFARLIAEGQQAMVDLALERTGRILDQRLPEDLQRQLSALQVVR